MFPQIALGDPRQICSLPSLKFFYFYFFFFPARSTMKGCLIERREIFVGPIPRRRSRAVRFSLLRTSSRTRDRGLGWKLSRAGAVTAGGFWNLLSRSAYFILGPIPLRVRITRFQPNSAPRPDKELLVAENSSGRLVGREYATPPGGMLMQPCACIFQIIFLSPFFLWNITLARVSHRLSLLSL